MNYGASASDVKNALCSEFGFGLFSHSMSVTDLKYIKAATLRAWFRGGSPGTFAVVDVRESDFVGGHIKGCWNYPAGNFQYTLGELQRRIVENNITNVVFHCALSQVRGPLSALKFLRSVDDVDERMKEKLKDVNVWVLRGGFTRWQEEYGEDEEVTEGWQRDLWE